MHAEDCPIHFSVELLHAPRAHSLAALQKLYFELSQTRHAAYLSSDFSKNGPPRLYSKRGERSESLALFLPDRVVVAEEWVSLPSSEFVKRVEGVAEHAARELAIAPFIAHIITIRTTFVLTHFNDARVFIFERMFNQEGRIGPYLGRPIAVGGLRLVLPELPEREGTLHVTVESFRYRQNEVFVEVKGVFGRPPLTPPETGALRDHFQGLRHFITDRIYPYLNQYDVPVEDAR